MKLSQLIAGLDAALALHGDVGVFVYDEDCAYELPASTISFEQAEEGGWAGTVHIPEMPDRICITA